MTASETTTESAAPPQPISPWTALAIGLAGAGVGMLPWWVHGARLPLQNLWATATPPAQMPLVLLPFSQYQVATLAALLLVGSTAAGLVARTWRSRLSRAGVAATVGGVLAVQLVAIVQTALTVATGLREDRTASVYLGALTVGSVAAVLLGLGLLLTIARAAKPVAAVALSVGAVAAGPWASQLLLGGEAGDPFPTWLLTALTWLPAVLVGVVLAWLGLRSAGQVLGAVVSLAVLWFGSALVTAVSAAVGSRVLADDPAEMLDYGIAVLVAALGAFSVNLVPAAICVALLVAAVRAILGNGQRPSS